MSAGISVLQRAWEKSAEKQRKGQGSEPQFDAARFGAAKFDAVRFDAAPKGPVAELGARSGLQRWYRHQCSAEGRDEVSREATQESRIRTSV